MNFKNQVAHWAKTNLENLNIVVIYNVIDNSPIQFVKQGLGCFLTTNDLFDSYAEEAVSFILLAVHPAGYRSVCGYGCRNL